MNKEEVLTILNVVMGSFLGFLASIPCMLWVYFMGFVSIYDCSYGDRCPPDLLIQWLLLDSISIMGLPIGPIINFVFIGIITGVVGGIIFYPKEQTFKNARLGVFLVH